MPFSTRFHRLSTAIGSVPHTDPAAAVRFMHRWTPGFCTIPQLPQRDPAEGVGRQLLWIVPGVLPTPEGGRVLPEHPPLVRTAWTGTPWQGSEAEGAFARHCWGYATFLESLRAGELGAYPRVKLPLTGPLTAAQMLTLADGSSAILDPGWRAHLGELVGTLAGAIVGELRSAGAGEIHVWLDEPALGAALSAIGEDALPPLAHALTAIRQAGAVAGVHCCAEIDFAQLAKLPLDVLSFDAAHYLPAFLKAIPAWGARPVPQIAWGIIDTWQPDTEPDLGALYEEWAESVQRAWPGVDVGELARNSIWTPACGLGLLTLPQAEAVMGRLERWMELLP